MRIAMVAPLVSAVADPPEGGVAAVVSDVSIALAARGHELTVYAAAGSVIPGVEVVDLGIDAASLRDALWRAGGAAGVANTAMDDAFGRIYDDAARRGFDVVHAHAFDEPSIRRAASLPMPFAQTVHVPPRDDIATALTECRARRAGATALATVSEQQRESWAAVTSVDAVLRNGVPVAAIPWREEPGQGVLIAARLSPEKGVAEGIAAARAAGLEVDVYGPPYDEAYAAELHRSWDGDGAVRLHGPLRRADLWAAMSRAMVVLCPAQWDEPCTLVAIEAQAAGTPVVATRRGGTPELLVDGATGRLAGDDSVAALSAALHETAALSRSGCRAHALEDLDIGAAAARHDALYARLCAS
jgi:glycosyltransferase involved in cell wall biosynthesis